MWALPFPRHSRRLTLNIFWPGHSSTINRSRNVCVNVNIFEKVLDALVFANRLRSTSLINHVATKYVASCPPNSYLYPVSSLSERASPWSLTITSLRGYFHAGYKFRFQPTEWLLIVRDVQQQHLQFQRGLAVSSIDLHFWHHNDKRAWAGPNRRPLVGKGSKLGWEESTCRRTQARFGIECCEGTN